MYSLLFVRISKEWPVMLFLLHEFSDYMLRFSVRGNLFHNLHFTMRLPFFGAFAKLRKSTTRCVQKSPTNAHKLFFNSLFLKYPTSFVIPVRPSVFLSVHPNGTTRLPLDVLLWNLIFECFSKICRENSSFIKFWQDYWVLCMKTYVHLWYYLA